MIITGYDIQGYADYKEETASSLTKKSRSHYRIFVKDMTITFVVIKKMFFLMQDRSITSFVYASISLEWHTLSTAMTLHYDSHQNLALANHFMKL